MGIKRKIARKVVKYSFRSSKYLSKKILNVGKEIALGAKDEIVDAYSRSAGIAFRKHAKKVTRKTIKHVKKNKKKYLIGSGGIIAGGTGYYALKKRSK